MSQYRLTVEVWATGKARRNRVRLRRSDDGTIRMEWWENGRHRVEFGFPWADSLTNAMKDRARAKARELLPNRTTFYPPAKMAAIRADLVAVARMMDRPAGSGPTRDEYIEHGRWSWTSVAAAFDGYKPKCGPPIQSWSQAVARFGLRPAKTLRFASYTDLVQDLLRVGKLIGKPNEMPPSHQYRLRGRHGANTIIRRTGATCWTEAGEKLGLSVPAWRLAARDRARGNKIASLAAHRRSTHASEIRPRSEAAA